jgi:hypothetical protein
MDNDGYYLLIKIDKLGINEEKCYRESTQPRVEPFSFYPSINHIYYMIRVYSCLHINYSKKAELYQVFICLNVHCVYK